MTKILAISEANAIAFHGMALIAKSGIAINANDIAEITGSSKHHTSKVLQRLVKQGMLGSTRGPSGGFYLLKPAKNIHLIEILESLEGDVSVSDCPIDNDICPFENCLMGGICVEIGATLIKYLKEHTLQNIIDNIAEDKNLFKSTK